MKKLAIFYHCLFQMDDKLLPAAVDIVQEQMLTLQYTGLLDAATEFHVGLNGGAESWLHAKAIIPKKAQITFHGLQCRNENRTIHLMWEWAKTHPDWNVLYFHGKGISNPAPHNPPWRNCMMVKLIHNWKQCIEDLETVESVGCHFLQPPVTPETQYIYAGNFYWVHSNFIATLPSIYERARIKEDGIDALSSRYESEVWIGNGARPPTVKDYCQNWTPGMAHAP